MEEWIGGSPYETTDERPIVRQKINDFIQNKFHKDVSVFTDQDILKLMRKAVRTLKKADLIETRSKLEYDKYKTTSYPAFLWQEKYVASFYFFATMLGYIDKKIDEKQKNIEFNESFLFADTEKDHPHKDGIAESNCKIQEYSLVREEVLDGYKSIIDKKDSHSDVILKTLEAFPSYNKFDSLYKDHKECGTQLYLNQQLINAYNLGYIFDKGTYDNVVNKYRQLYGELFTEKQHNDSIVFNQRQDDSKKKVLK